MPAEKENTGLHITEGQSGYYVYHLSVAGTNSVGLCGAKTMLTAIPLKTWGFKGHLNERYCEKCASQGSAELILAGANV